MDPQRERVLVVRSGRAGDLVMITPALRAILVKHPRAELHLLTSADGRRVLRGFDPRVTHFVIYQRGGFNGFCKRRRLAREIAAAGYQAIYCFESNPSYRKLLAPSAAKKYFLTPATETTPYPERCLRVVSDRFDSPQWLWLPVTDKGRDAAQTMLANAGISAVDFVVGLHPSFSQRRKLTFSACDARRRKTWPVESFARLAALLTEYAARHNLKLRVMCDLLPEERALGESLVAHSGGRVTLCTEPPDFERYKATIARMNLLVTPDTGPMHIAAALGTPLVALFHGRDPRDCGPYTDPARYVVLRAEDMAQPEQGLAAIPPETVFEACQRFLKKM